MIRYRSYVSRLAAVGFAMAALATAGRGAPIARADTPAPPRALVAATIAPTLILREVQPGGTEVRAFALSSAETALTATVKAVVSTTPTNPGPGAASSAAAAPLTAGLLSVGGAPASLVYDTKHSLRLTGLKPNTTYDLDLAAVTRTGVRLTAHARFTTLKQRVRLTIDTITITDDGDTFGEGEPTWFWSVGWSGGAIKDCFPKSAGHCQEGGFREGVVFPACTRGDRDHRTCAYSYVFAEENFQPAPNPQPQPGSEDFTAMPRQFLVSVAAHESDSFLGPLDAVFDWGAWLGGNAEASWQAPQGEEHARQKLTASANDGNFRSVIAFTFEVFYDNQSYTPTDGRVASAAK